MPTIKFDAITRSDTIYYDLEGAYGPNTDRLRGPNHPYLFLLLTGEPITDGMMVSTWAQIQDSEYSYNAGDDTNVNITTHEKVDGYETVVCSVRYNASATYIPYSDVVVKTYFSEDSSITETDTEVDVWQKSVNTFSEANYKERYPQRTVDDMTQIGCFVQRAASDDDSHYNLKNDVGYTVKMGYRVYNSTYSLGSSKWSSGMALYEAESAEIEFYWWSIEGAASLATGLALFSVLFV